MEPYTHLFFALWGEVGILILNKNRYNNLDFYLNVALTYSSPLIFSFNLGGPYS